MANLETIVDALKEALSQVEGLHVTTIPSNINAPAAQIAPAKVDFTGAMGRGHENWLIHVRILISIANQESAQAELFKYFGQAKDIKDLIESHVPLLDGTAAHAVFVREAEDYGRIYMVQGIEYRGIEFAVEVKA